MNTVGRHLRPCPAQMLDHTAPDGLTCGGRPESHPGQGPGQGPRPRAAGCEPPPGHRGAAEEEEGEAKRRSARLAGERFHTSRPPAEDGGGDGNET